MVWLVGRLGPPAREIGEAMVEVFFFVQFEKYSSAVDIHFMIGAINVPDPFSFQVPCGASRTGDVLVIAGKSLSEEAPSRPFQNQADARRHRSKRSVAAMFGFAG